MPLIKFSSLFEDVEPYRYPNLWQIEQTTGPQRIVLAPATDQIDLLVELTRQLPEPFGVLYVLTVPRKGEHEPGRYQSEQPCSRSELEAFLDRFRDYFEQDGRHNLWVFSLPSRAQIIYDNHNVLYGYGPLESFASVAQSRGMTNGEVRFPSPHAHHYHAEFDADERAILGYWEWKYFPLQESDEG